MKRTLAVMALLGAVGLANAQTIENPILKKLVEKGILKEDEAAAIDEQLAQEEAEKAKYQAEIDKTAMEAKEKLAKLEKEGSMSSLLTGKFKKFEIGGKAYLGYTYTTIKRKYHGEIPGSSGKYSSNNVNDSGDFEARRFYFDTKAYISDKDYIRFTTDLSQGTDYKLKIKYGYLYKDISDLIPHTGFEFGIAHTPWIDYEESSGWSYRAVDKTFMESSDSMGLWGSADLGINFKTKTPYVTSEIGMFNGEGYDKINTKSQNSSGFHNSFEGRVTYHVFGNGDKGVNPTKDQYANISLHLASNIGYNDAYTTHKNLNLYHIHAVYNHPMFLIAAQYAKTDYNSSSLSPIAGDGYSINAEVRPVQDWSIFGRFDHWRFKKELTFKNELTPTGFDTKDAAGNDIKADRRDAYYFGVAYTMNKYVKWIANVINYDYKGTNPDYKDKSKYMLTAELSW
jgi:hypothetical protein